MVKKGKSGSVNFNPDNMASGGFLDAAQATMTACQTAMFDFNGAAEQPQACFCVTYVTDAGDEYEQHYSVGGAPGDWEINEDETGFVYAGAGSGQITKVCSFGKLIKSLCDAGFDPDKIENDVTVFEGLEVKLISVPQGKRKDGGERRPLILIDEILNTGDAEDNNGKEKGAGKNPASKKASRQGSSKKTAAEDDINQEATILVLDLLGDSEEAAIKVSKIPALAFKKIANMKYKADILRLLNNRDFYKSGPWEYDDVEKTIC